MESSPLFDALAQKIRLGTPLPLFWDWSLRAATPVTRLSMAYRLRQAVESVDAHVVSFGNITAGGTGKTPAVIERVRAELAAGRKVAVVTRGYGSEKVDEPFVVPPDMARAEIARLVGDEPALIRHHAPECVLIKAARRIEGARCAVEDHGCAVVVLDDAFQHVQIARDENICLIDASNPFGSGHLLPRGILREPLSALSRATEILLTRCDQAVDLAGLRETIAAQVPHLPMRETVHAPGRLWRLCDGESVSVSDLADSEVTAVSGIGNPEAFVRTLASAGVMVSHTQSFRDHAILPRDVFDRPGIVVVTEKDAMRIVDPPENVVALEVRLEDWGQ